VKYQYKGKKPNEMETSNPNKISSKCFICCRNVRNFEDLKVKINFQYHLQDFDLSGQPNLDSVQSFSCSLHAKSSCVS
jgi:RecB family endonuclease NucS